MSDASGTGEPDGFAALLRELKDRAGLSYGTLAKRLHMSTSTLHRYCNGSAVPHDYAPVERLARLCRATPQELVELHRRWILADAARGARAERAAPEGTSGAVGAVGAVGAGGAGGASGVSGASGASGVSGAVGAGEASGTGEAGGTSGASGAGGASGASGTSGAGGASGTSGAGGASGTSGAGGASAGSASESAGGSSGTVGETSPSTSGGPSPLPLPTPAPTPTPGAAPTPHADAPLVADIPHDNAPAPTPALSRRRRNALIAAVAVAVVLGAGVLAVGVPFGGKETAGRSVAEATGLTTPEGASGKPSAKESASPSPSGTSPGPSVSASASAGTGTTKGEGKQGAPTPTADSTAVPLNVGTRPYVYDNPCSQHFLVDSEPEQVGPPASEQDAPRWAAAYGAVSSGDQRVALTVQGAGQDTVVLEALHVRVVSKGAPLAWNDYSMGVGCGGGVETKSFDVDLDNGSPSLAVKNGQRDFPYKVSESDPEVFYVTAHAKAHDVRWDLTLDWSSGSRRGTVHIDNNGTPFRTSGDVGRPGYDYPLGGSEWIERE
ncbi:helix-turn-helix domain-containing protein [Streptomyces sp. NPDC087212]|uniref:helix-turn-helix domain-containing protein n=1 Tax=Streptomyces sp. NPDC087212 TaxID=3365766 RepID=UPI003806A648